MNRDCFAYSIKHKNRCNALNALVCATGQCKFYKTKEQLQREQAAIDKRLGSEKSAQPAHIRYRYE